MNINPLDFCKHQTQQQQKARLDRLSRRIQNEPWRYQSAQWTPPVKKIDQLRDKALKEKKDDDTN